MIKRKKTTKKQKTNWAIKHATSLTAFFSLNKIMCKMFGPEKAVFLCNLSDKLRYFEQRNMTKGGWFFQTHDQQISETGLTEYGIKTCKKFFSELGVIELKKKGLPAKEHYKIDFIQLDEIIDNYVAGLDPPISGGQDPKDSVGLAPKDSGGLYKKNIYNKNKVKNNKDKKMEIFILDSLNNEKDSITKLNKHHPYYILFIQKLPSNLQTQDVMCSVYEYFEYRKETKNKINSKLTVTKLVNQIKNLNEDSLIQTIDDSISKGWTGLFPKEYKNNHRQQKSYQNKHTYQNKQSPSTYPSYPNYDTALDDEAYLIKKAEEDFEQQLRDSSFDFSDVLDD